MVDLRRLAVVHPLTTEYLFHSTLLNSMDPFLVASGTSIKIGSPFVPTRSESKRSLATERHLQRVVQPANRLYTFGSRQTPADYHQGRRPNWSQNSVVTIVARIVSVQLENIGGHTAPGRFQARPAMKRDHDLPWMEYRNPISELRWRVACTKPPFT